MSEPTLSHDIEEWIKDHSHASIYASLGNVWAQHLSLEDRVARLEEFMVDTSEWHETLRALPQEPRGPHD